MLEPKTEHNYCQLIPELNVLILVEDRDYIQSLLNDFVKRSKRDPAALFKQLSSLWIGSLLTQEVGTDIMGDQSLSELLSRFIELDKAQAF